MEDKKSQQADLQNKRGMMFLTGLLIAFGLIYIVLNYETPKVESEETTVEIPGIEIINLSVKP